MPFDLTLPDAAALAWFLGVWLAYNLVLDRLLRRPASLNRHMRDLRGRWMARMLERDNRIADTALIGHLIHSVSFFASTTMLVLAGLVGVIGTLDNAYRAIAALGFIAPVTRPLFELKVLLLLGIFAFSFFKFTWALRQYNYCCALIGAAPSHDALPADATARAALARDGAEVLSGATRSFNSGLRAYYFALAALAWFVQPWLFAAATAWVAAVLLRRQFLSGTARAVRGFSRAAGDAPRAEP